MIDSTVGPFGVYTMNLDGSELKPIAIPGDTVYFPGGPTGDYYVIESYFPLSNPRWSPDGQKVVCTLMWTFEGYAIMLMNADGSNKHVLSTVWASAQQPQWSPEGDRILFMRSGYLGAVFATGIVDTNGENDRDFEIAGDTNPYIFEGDSVWFVGDYQCGPTGNLIYGSGFVNKRPKSPNLVGSNPENEIFSFDSNTGRVLRRLTRNDLDEGAFQLSKDGRYVAFRRDDSPERSSFFILSLVDASMRQVGVDGRVDFFWNWSTDSKRIVFAKDENPSPWRENLYLYMLDVERFAASRKLTSFQAREPDLFIPH